MALLETIVFFILAMLALLGALPGISWFFAYYLYHPRLDIFFPPPGRAPDSVRWSELSSAEGTYGSFLHVSKKSNAEVTMEIECIIDRPWKSRQQLESTFPFSGLAGGYPRSGGFLRRSMPIRLAPGSGVVALAFPFEPQPEKCSLTVVVHPRIQLSELRLPKYFGYVDLKPIRAHFVIVA